MAVRRPSLVLFDLDGTLVDSSADIARALNLVLGRRGLPQHSLAGVRGMVGGGVGRLVARAVPAASAALCEELVCEFRAIYAVQLVRETRPYPGIADLLRRAPSIRKAVLTNKPGGLARLLCSALGLAPYLAMVLGDDDLPRRKPDPVGVDRVRERFGAARDQVLYVGDSSIDLATAQAAGVRSCIVTWGYRDADLRLADASHVADSAADVAALLGPAGA